MKPEIVPNDYSKEAVDADYNATLNDCIVLEEITKGLRRFVYESYGEDRSSFKPDIVKYDNLLNIARGIKEKIQKFRATL